MGLQAVELIMAVEEEFAVEFSDAEASVLQTVGGMQEAILQKLRARGEVPQEQIVWEKLRQVIVEQTGVRIEEVVPSAEFIQDLGVN